MIILSQNNMHDNVSLFSLFVYFKKFDRVVCFVLPDEFSTVSGISTLFHVTSDNLTFPKCVSSSWTKPRIMIVCCYYCQIKSVPSLFSGSLQISSPPLHLRDPIFLYLAKIFFLYGPVPNEPYVEKVCCNYWSSYSSKLS
jgi:hypothetical protein